MFKLKQIISHVHSEPHCVIPWISQDQGAVLSCLVVTEWSFPSGQKKRSVVMLGSSQVGICRSAWMSNRMLLTALRSLSLPLEVKGWNFKKQSQHALCLASSGPTTSEPQCARRKVFPSWWSCCAPTPTRWFGLWPSPCATCLSTAATRTWSVQTSLIPHTHQKEFLFQIYTHKAQIQWASLLSLHAATTATVKILWLIYSFFKDRFKLIQVCLNTIVTCPYVHWKSYWL